MYAPNDPDDPNRTPPERMFQRQGPSMPASTYSAWSAQRDAATSQQYGAAPNAYLTQWGAPQGQGYLAAQGQGHQPQHQPVQQPEWQFPAYQEPGSRAHTPTPEPVAGSMSSSSDSSFDRRQAAFQQQRAREQRRAEERARREAARQDQAARGGTSARGATAPRARGGSISAASRAMEAYDQRRSQPATRGRSDSNPMALAAANAAAARNQRGRGGR